MWKHLRWLPLGCCLLAFGCGPGGAPTPDVVPAGGTVLYNGQPVSGATVSFSAEAAPRAATGVTNAQGEFQLSTFGANDGAVPGEHVITVTKVDSSGPVASTPGKMDEKMRDPSMSSQMYQQQMQGRGAALPAGPKHLLPEKYSQSTSTSLKETVTREGPNKFVLQLSD